MPIAAESVRGEPFSSENSWENPVLAARTAEHVQVSLEKEIHPMYSGRGWRFGVGVPEAGGWLRYPLVYGK